MRNSTPAGRSSGSSHVDETYDPETFSKKYGMPLGEAKTIIKRYGPSRKKVDAYMAARNA